MSTYRASVEQSIGQPPRASRCSGAIAYTGGRGLPRESLHVGPSFALSDTPEGRRSQGNPLLQTQMWGSKRWRERRNKARRGDDNPNTEAIQRSEDRLSPYLNWLQWLSLVMPSDKLSKSQRGPWNKSKLLDLVVSLFNKYANSNRSVSEIRRGFMNRDEFIDMCNWETDPGTETPRAKLEELWIAVKSTQKRSDWLSDREGSSEQITLEHWINLFKMEEYPYTEGYYALNAHYELVKEFVGYLSKKLERWWSTWEPQLHTDTVVHTREAFLQPGLAQYVPLKWFYNIPKLQQEEFSQVDYMRQEQEDEENMLLTLWTLAGERGTLALERNRIEQHLMHACLLYVTGRNLLQALGMGLTYRERKQAMQKVFRESDSMTGITRGEPLDDGTSDREGAVPDYQRAVTMDVVFVSTVNRTGCAVYLPHPTLPVILEGFLTCCINCDTGDCDVEAQCLVTYNNFVQWTDFEFDPSGLMDQFGAGDWDTTERPEFNQAVDTSVGMPNPRTPFGAGGLGVLPDGGGGAFKRMGEDETYTKFLFHLEVVHWRTEDEPLRMSEQEYDSEARDMSTQGKAFLYNRGKNWPEKLPYKPRVPRSSATKTLWDEVYEANYKRVWEHEDQRVLSAAEQIERGLAYRSEDDIARQRYQRSDAHREHLAREFADRRSPDTYLGSSAGLQWKMAPYKEAPLFLTVPNRGTDASGNPVRIPFAEFLLEDTFFEGPGDWLQGGMGPTVSAGMLISANDLTELHPAGDRYLVSDLYDLYPDGPGGQRPFSGRETFSGGEEDGIRKTSEFAPWTPEAETEAALREDTEGTPLDGSRRSFSESRRSELASKPGNAFSRLGQCNVFFGGGTCNSHGIAADEFAYLIDRPYPADDRPPAIPTDPLSALKMCRAAQTAPRSQTPQDLAETRLLKQSDFAEDISVLQRELRKYAELERDDKEIPYAAMTKEEIARLQRAQDQRRKLLRQLSELELRQKEFLLEARSIRQTFAHEADSSLKFRLAQRTPFYNAEVDALSISEEAALILQLEPLGVPANAVKTWRWPATDRASITRLFDILPQKNQSGQLTMINATRDDARCPLDRMRDFMLYPSLYLTQPKRVYEMDGGSL